MWVKKTPQSRTRRGRDEIKLLLLRKAQSTRENPKLKLSGNFKIQIIQKRANVSRLGDRRLSILFIQNY